MGYLTHNGKRIVTLGKYVAITGGSPSPSIVTFTKSDYGSEVDHITDNVWISRGDNQGLFNAKLETYDNFYWRVSPIDTEWNWQDWTNISNLRDRDYLPWGEFVYEIGQGAKDLPGRETILHCISEDKYYKVKVLTWTSGDAGGGFSYEREFVPESQLAPLPTSGMRLKAFNEYSDYQVAFSVVTDGGVDYTVNWGDTTENFASGTTAEHSYLANSANVIDITSSAALKGFRLRPTSVPQEQSITSAQFFESNFSDLSYAFYDEYSQMGSLAKVLFPQAPMNSLENLDYAFYGCDSITQVALPTELNNLQSMRYSFAGTNITSMVLPNTLNSLVNMEHCFEGTDLRSFQCPTNMPLLQNMSFAFNTCYALQGDIVLSNQLTSLTNLERTFANTQVGQVTIDAPNVEDMTSTFNSSQVTSVSIASDKLVSLKQTFEYVSSLSTVTFAATSLPYLTDMSAAFSGCTSLTSFTMPSTPNVENVSYSFSNCQNLTNSPISGSLSKVTTMLGCFYNCYNIASISLTDLSEVTNMSQTFYATGSAIYGSGGTSLTLPSSLPKLYDVAGMFTNSAIITLNLPDLSPSIGDEKFPEIFTDYNALQNLTINDIPAVSYISGTFSGKNLASLVFAKPCPNLQIITNIAQNNIYLENVDIHNLTNLWYMDGAFQNSPLSNLTLPDNFNKLIRADYAFSNCSGITSIAIPDTSIMNSAVNMFSNCANLTDVSMGKMTSLANAQGMFENCPNLSSISFPTSLPALTNGYTLLANTKLVNVTLPQLPVIVALEAAMSSCPLLETVNFNPVIGNTLNTSQLDSLWYNTPNLNTVNLVNSAFDATHLNKIFSNLPTNTGGTRNIDISGAVGAAGCNRAIATGKGWTVIG